MKIGIVYTTHGKALSDAVEREVLRAFGEDTQLLNRWDESILEEVVQAGKITRGAATRLLRLYLDVMEEGCDGILNVCSSVGEAADAMKVYGDLVGVPVVRIDEAMCRQALLEYDNIAVLATLSSTIPPTTRLLERCAKEAGKEIILHAAVAESAFGLCGEDLAAALAVAASGVKEAQCLILAQASMSTCGAELEKRTGKKVYTSPHLGALALAKTLKGNEQR